MDRSLRGGPRWAYNQDLVRMLSENKNHQRGEDDDRKKSVEDQVGCLQRIADESWRIPVGWAVVGGSWAVRAVGPEPASTGLRSGF
jgi:hypothetical protein